MARISIGTGSIDSNAEEFREARGPRVRRRSARVDGREVCVRREAMIRGKSERRVSWGDGREASDVGVCAMKRSVVREGAVEVGSCVGWNPIDSRVLCK